MKKYPSMDEMIASCEEKKTENETICYALGSGRIIPKLGMKKYQKEAIDYIKTLDGFIGVHIVDIWHTLLIFDTLNNAKAAKNTLKAKNCPVGNVVPILVPNEYAKGGKA